MSPDGEIASVIIEKITELLNYEMLVSAPGIVEPDSNFMWASNFRAPTGINVINDEVFLNLFLPEGSEQDKDKKIFFSRVDAKLQDGLWQVRRDFNDLSEVYGSVIKMALGTFRSVILDYSYIQEGKYFAHFSFNEKDLEGISSVLISLTEVMSGYKIEYLKKVREKGKMFSGVDEIAEVTTFSLELLYLDEDVAEFQNDTMCHFVMANFLEGGIKAIGTTQNNSPPALLGPREVINETGNISYFKVYNKDIIQLVKGIVSSFIILYGLYGTVSGNCIRLMLPIPTQQTGLLLEVLNKLKQDSPELNLKLLEVSRFSENKFREL